MKTMLRQERVTRDWSQEYVANQVGITPEAVSMLENGQRYPSFKVLVKLLDLFGYSDPRLLFAPADETSNLSGEL